MHPEILKYNQQQEHHHKDLCDVLDEEIDRNLPKAKNKIWHAHPVWFLEGNPIVGYRETRYTADVLERDRF